MALDGHRVELSGEDERRNGYGGVALDNAPALERAAEGELGLALHACVKLQHAWCHTTSRTTSHTTSYSSYSPCIPASVCIGGCNRVPCNRVWAAGSFTLLTTY